MKVLPDILRHERGGNEKIPNKQKTNCRRATLPVKHCFRDLTARREFQNGGAVEVLENEGKNLGVLDFCFCIQRVVLAYNCGLIICAKFLSSLLINIERISHYSKVNIVKRNAKV